ncbi:LOW QUALITY PROTEIN: hypothetical protein IFM46972_11585, partial [Aspergillus udagawae]
IIIVYVLETSCSPNSADLDNFSKRVNKALGADWEEATQDNYIRASVEWRWQEYANQGQVIREKWAKAAPNSIGINWQPQISTASAYKSYISFYSQIYMGYCGVSNPGNYL